MTKKRQKKKYSWVNEKNIRCQSITLSFSVVCCRVPLPSLGEESVITFPVY